MKITTTGKPGYLVIKELTGYGPDDRPKYKLHFVKLPKKITPRFLLKLVMKLAIVDEAAIVEDAASVDDAKRRLAAQFGDDITFGEVEYMLN